MAAYGWSNMVDEELLLGNGEEATWRPNACDRLELLLRHVTPLPERCVTPAGDTLSCHPARARELRDEPHAMREAHHGVRAPWLGDMTVCRQPVSRSVPAVE